MIGLHGKMGSGKDTVLERLQAAQPATFQQVSFAAKLKEATAELLGTTVEKLEELKRDDSWRLILGEYGKIDQMVGEGLTIREVLQRMGTEVGRNLFGDNFWVDQAMAVVDRYDTIPVFTDVRFENEALAIRERGGVIVRVIGDYEDTGDHASEVPLPDALVDFTIDNSRRDDGFAALDRHVTFLLDEIGVSL